MNFYNTSFFPNGEEAAAGIFEKSMIMIELKLKTILFSRIIVEKPLGPQENMLSN